MFYKTTAGFDIFVVTKLQHFPFTFKEDGEGARDQRKFLSRLVSKTDPFTVYQDLI